VRRRRGDISRFDDAANGKRGAQLGAAGVELVEPDARA
jgi:hypothetical protein